MIGTLIDRVNYWRRRLWGHFTLDDPRPIAAEARYTYFLPQPETLAALAPGDLVKLVFRGAPASRQWDAERMWVQVTEIGPDGLVGRLDNDPSDMPQLKAGQTVRFQLWHVVDVDFADAQRAPVVLEPRQYWERCLVDDCVLYEGVPVGYLYREAPEDWEDDGKFPDSGWRIRGDFRGVAPEALEARTSSYVALGAVLNRDDSWLDLIDQPIGSAFDRDFERDVYVEEGAA